MVSTPPATALDHLHFSIMSSLWYLKIYVHLFHPPISNTWLLCLLSRHSLLLKFKTIICNLQWELPCLPLAYFIFCKLLVNLACLFILFHKPQTLSSLGQRIVLENCKSCHKRYGNLGQKDQMRVMWQHCKTDFFQDLHYCLFLWQSKYL